MNALGRYQGAPRLCSITAERMEILPWEMGESLRRIGGRLSAEEPFIVKEQSRDRHTSRVMVIIGAAD